MVSFSDNLMANFDIAIHQLSTQIVNGQRVAPIGINEELKSAIAGEVRSQMVPVVKQIVREVADEVKSVITDVMTPLYDELRDFRNRVPLPSSFLYSSGNIAVYTSGSLSSSCNILVSFFFCFFISHLEVSLFQ